MANKFATNFTIPSSTNVFQVLWKLTRVMKAAGWNTVSHSDGTTKQASGTNGNDSWGSNADPLVDTYPTFDAAAPWIVMQGPSTLKIPITGNPSGGTALRGETVTQTATSFEGELLGYVYDSVGASGYMVVMPRVNTPTNATAIVGSSSAASFTPTGTIVTYRREVMFGKATAGNTVSGLMWYICADASGESAQLFSTLAGSAGATATIPPGAGGTGNTFPTLGMVIRGTGGSTTVAAWFGNVTTGFATYAQIACANATPATGVTADGSFWTALPTQTYNQTTGFMFTRVDDQEPGDVDPYIWITEQSATFAAWSRTAFTGSSAQVHAWTVGNIGAGSTPCLVGYQARGITTGSRDVVAPFAATCVGAGNQAGTYAQTIQGVPGPFRQLATTAPNPAILRELVSIVCPGTTTGTFRQIKGRCRWLAYASMGNTLDTFDSKTWFCVTTVGASLPAIILGPYDGLSTPVF